MQFIREEGYTAAGFSREITVIDYGFTTDTARPARRAGLRRRCHKRW